MNWQRFFKLKQGRLLPHTTAFHNLITEKDAIKKYLNISDHYVRCILRKQVVIQQYINGNSLIAVQELYGTRA